jgi:hypothetical protein
VPKSIISNSIVVLNTKGQIQPFSYINPADVNELVKEGKLLKDITTRPHRFHIKQ